MEHNTKGQTQVKETLFQQLQLLRERAQGETGSRLIASTLAMVELAKVLLTDGSVGS